MLDVSAFVLVIECTDAVTGIPQTVVNSVYSGHWCHKHGYSGPLMSQTRVQWARQSLIGVQWARQSLIGVQWAGTVVAWITVGRYSSGMGYSGPDSQ